MSTYFCLVLLLVTTATAQFSFGQSWINGDVISEIKNRFVEYTFRVDRVLSGDNSPAALDDLMDMFSPSFTTWNTILVPDSEPTPPPADVLLEGGVRLDQLRERYSNITTQFYANFSQHNLMEIQVNFKQFIRPLVPLFNTKGMLFEVANLQIFPPPNQGAVIIGSYNCDWVLDYDGKFRMYRFFTNTRKIGSFVLPLGNNIYATG